ncbi:unnamed protein product [Closterium sp. NIES-53]
MVLEPVTSWPVGQPHASAAVFPVVRLGRVAIYVLSRARVARDVFSALSRRGPTPGARDGALSRRGPAPGARDGGLSRRGPAPGARDGALSRCGPTLAPAMAPLPHMRLHSVQPPLPYPRLPSVQPPLSFTRLPSVQPPLPFPVRHPPPPPSSFFSLLRVQPWGGGYGGGGYGGDGCL